VRLSLVACASRSRPRTLFSSRTPYSSALHSVFQLFSHFSYCTLLCQYWLLRLCVSSAAPVNAALSLPLSLRLSLSSAASLSLLLPRPSFTSRPPRPPRIVVQPQPQLISSLGFIGAVDRSRPRPATTTAAAATTIGVCWCILSTHQYAIYFLGPGPSTQSQSFPSPPIPRLHK
jgi:hypothetical protein